MMCGECEQKKYGDWGKNILLLSIKVFSVKPN